MKQEKKTTCETKGHFWQSTTSPFIHRCGRTGCKAMRHCINGVWRDTLPDHPKPSTVPVTQQTELWA